MEKQNDFFLTTMIGSSGRVVSALNPEGKVKIQGELWRAIAVDAPINPGEEIMVVKQKGLTLTVTRHEDADKKNTSII